MTSPRLWMIGLTTVFGLTLFTVVDGALAKSGQADPGYQPKAGSSHAVTTFYADVMPILQENCVDCHQPQGLKPGGMVAPMSFMTYSEVRPWAKAMASQVQARLMPPWGAALVHEGTFQDERILTDQEIAILVKWAQTGGAAGNPSDAPDPIAWDTSGGWSIGEPDIIVKMTEPYVVEDDVQDQYNPFNVTIPREQLPEAG